MLSTDRPPEEVVNAHLGAIVSGDPKAMMADYAEDAIMMRGIDIYQGQDEILGYFKTVPDRLAGGRLVVLAVNARGEGVSVKWRISGGPGNNVSGTDMYVVVDGMISQQSVVLDGADF